MAKRFAHLRPSPIESLENRILLATVPVGFSYTTLAAGPFNRPTAMRSPPTAASSSASRAARCASIKNGGLLATPF